MHPEETFSIVDDGADRQFNADRSRRRLQMLDGPGRSLLKELLDVAERFPGRTSGLSARSLLSGRTSATPFFRAGIQMRAYFDSAAKRPDADLLKRVVNPSWRKNGAGILDTMCTVQAGLATNGPAARKASLARISRAMARS
jgi:aspartate carbamoyltransferase catalytic subunit